MKVSKIIAAAVAAVSMLGASTAFAAAPAASKLSVSASPAVKAVRAGGLKKGDKSNGFLSNPLVIAGIVATAIAIPVALGGSNHHPASP